MGMDLAIMPLDQGWFGGGLAWSRLSFDRDYDLFGQLHDFDGKGKIKANPLPPGASIGHYEDEGLRQETTDPYGTPLTWAPAVALKKLKESERTTPWNKAILAFINALPDETVVVLWWH